MDWTWLLNNDTVVARDSLTEMVKLGQKERRVGVVGCKIVYHQHPDMIQAAGGARFYFCLGVSRNYGWRNRSELWAEPFEPHYLSGASMLVRAEAWRNVGHLDEAFFFYGEEVDWQLRARKKGWRSIYCPWSIVYHHEKATAGKLNVWADYQYTRSNILVCRRHAPWWLPAAVVAGGLRALRRMCRGQYSRAAAILKGVVVGVWSDGRCASDGRDARRWREAR